jgi:hypothetical protein
MITPDSEENFIAPLFAANALSRNFRIGAHGF